VSERKIRLVIPSSLEHVALAGCAAGALARYAGLDEKESCQIQLCVLEAANNCIRHAYEGRADGEVEILCLLAGDSLEVGVSDRGTPIPGGLRFRPLAFDPDDVASLPEGGMGLHIIRNVMDSVSYSSAGGRNTLTMTRRISASADAAAKER